MDTRIQARRITLLSGSYFPCRDATVWQLGLSSSSGVFSEERPSSCAFSQRFSSSSNPIRSSRACVCAPSAVIRASNVSRSVAVSGGVDAVELTRAIIPCQLLLGSAKHRKMQRFVRLHPPHIISVEQPVELLHGKRHHRLRQMPRPMKFVLL